MGVLRLVAQIRDLGQQVVAVFIEIPVFLARHIGVVGMGEADGQAPRSGVISARQIVNLARRVIGNLVIVFELVGDFRNPCPGHRTHIVVPPVDALTGFAVVWRPAKIRWVDVGGQAFLNAV